MQFDLPKEQSPIIKVIGVGGGGSNAVNHMFEQGIRGVNFVISNTDGQAMELSPIPNKIQLGPSLTEGLGAGSNPAIGRKATEESLEEIRDILEKNTKMVFVTAGMGGGTGTGGAPVIAKVAKEMGILTVGIVTTPFFFEGRRKMIQAQEGIEELRRSVDSLIVISNDKIREIYGNLTRSDAFARADNILSIAAKSISEIITVAGQINVDFADVEYVMKDSGVAIMGSAVAEGEDRAARAVQAALSSPLLNDNNIIGARKILLNITSGSRQVLIDEITEIHEYVLEAATQDTDVIFGTCDDETLEDKISVTLIATGFEEKKSLIGEHRQSGKVVHRLDQNSEITPPPAEEAPVPGSSMTFNFLSGADPEKADDSDKGKAPVSNIEEPEQEQQEQQEQPEQQMEESNTVELDARFKEESESPFTLTRKTDNAHGQQGPENNNDAMERLRRLRNLNLKLNNPQNITELENEPAFKRRNIQLNSTPHSSESNYSRYTLSAGEDEEGDKTEMKKNNSFLHDNVD